MAFAIEQMKSSSIGWVQFTLPKTNVLYTIEKEILDQDDNLQKKTIVSCIILGLLFK